VSVVREQAAARSAAILEVRANGFALGHPYSGSVRLGEGTVRRFRRGRGGGAKAAGGPRAEESRPAALLRPGESAGEVARLPDQAIATRASGALAGARLDRSEWSLGWIGTTLAPQAAHN